MVLVQFEPRTVEKAGPNDRALILTLRSPRPDGSEATSPDPADWSVEEAMAVVRQFLPADVALAETATPAAMPVSGAGFAESCQSETLAAVFPDAPAEGACEIAAVMPTPETVSYLTLLVGDEDGSYARVADRCEGIASWGRAAGTAMQAALAIIGTVATVDDDDPQAPVQLHDAAGHMSQLATTQSAVSPPRAATRANSDLTAAFEGFATALSEAATGLETNDREALAQAVANLVAAHVRFDAANALVLATLQRCGAIE